MSTPHIRTECACDECIKCCQHMPGYLVPGDLFTIGTRLGYSGCTKGFVARYLLASEGALVQAGDRRFRIPTIVPAQKADGSCVFLNDQHRCDIHAVAPFGCAHFDTHMSKEDADQLSTDGLRRIMQDIHEDGTYKAVLELLFNSDRVASPLLERKRKLLAASTPRCLETIP